VETCPKCNAKFPPSAGRGYATLTVFRGGALDTKVSCPECHHVFQPRTGRHFAMKLLVGACVAFAVLALVYLLVLEPLLNAAR
jgi:hypothetical protein